MWQKAHIKDVPVLTEMFFNVLSAKPSYVSHGEMQMGVADENRHVIDGARERWEAYVKKSIQNKSRIYPSCVLKYQKNGKIIAFGIFEVMSDGYHKFGVVADMVVHHKFRRHGLGEQLLNLGKEWFYTMGITDIYLESGLFNHSAHDFYKNRGFKKVSYVFRLCED